MASAIKLKSGSWRCTAFLGRDKNGKQIRKSFTAPTKKEAETLARACEVKEKKSMQCIDKRDLTVLDAIDRYINKKEAESEKGKISPATLRSYKSMRDHVFEDIASIPVLRIDDSILNEWIDTLEEDHKPKTCKNAWSLCRASLIDVLPRSTVIDWRIELPKISKAKVNVPLEKDILTVLQHYRNKDFEMYNVCLLAAFGTLRRSEICALTADDIDRATNTVHINKALVLNDKKEWVLKDTKTESSTRDVVLPAFVINALPESGKIFNSTPVALSDRFRRCIQKFGMHFRFHDLRHYSASIMHQLGASNETIMHRGGWSNDYTLNQHYRGVMSEYDAAFTKKLNNHFEKKFAIK